MDKTALLIIDVQQEYFAPVGKMVLPDGPKAVKRIASPALELHPAFSPGSQPPTKSSGRWANGAA